MDRMRSRRPTFKTQPSIPPKAMREQFKPAIVWTEDPSNQILLVYLPGFKREEITVQLDKIAGKLLIKGSKQVADNKYLDVDQSLDVPKDTIIEKISGRFEDGRLTLMMPKRVVEEQKATQKGKEPSPEEKPYSAEEKKEEETIQKEAKTDEEKKEELIKEEQMSREKKEEPKKKEPIKEEQTSREEKEEPMREEKPTGTEEKQRDEPVCDETPTATEEKPKSSEVNKDEPIQKEKPKPEGEKKEDEPDLKEKQESEEEKKHDGPVRQEQMEEGEEKKDEPVETEKLESIEEKKKEDSVQTEKAMSGEMERRREEKNIQKMKSKMGEIGVDKPKEISKRISIWRGDEDRWLDSGSLDGMSEKLNRNRKVMIAVALVAFSVGFYVSHKLRTSAR